MFGMGTSELLIILVIVVIIFGVGKLPELGSGLGKAIKNFKKATSDELDSPAKSEAHKIDGNAAKKDA
ncbi:MAG: twin-arginine translocase TatA/TatE family subunit [Deltaproteobacteria bacterium]|nr:twin-arginine translocase TatA/TatE family subunit [Deltaproteobacteria bacterium]